MASLRRILLRLVWLLIAVSGLAILAAFVPPTLAWPLALLAILLPALGLFLLISLLLTAAVKKWIPFSLALVMLLVVLTRHVAPDRLMSRAPNSADLTLMSYNSPKDPNDDQARTEVSALVTRVDPDVIALQEAVVWVMKRAPEVLHTFFKLSDVIDSLHYVVEMPPKGGPPEAQWANWDPPVLLKFTPDKQEHLDVEGRKEDWPSFSILRTELTWEGRKMAIYNVHLTSHGVNKPWRQPGGLLSIQAWSVYLSEIKKGFEVREWEVKRVREFLETEKLPVVLAGDFNSTPDSWAYSHLSRGLQDAYRASGSGWGATYHATYPVVRIDFVLLGQEFEPVRAFVAGPHPTSSDHRPLVARFRWRSETN